MSGEQPRQPLFGRRQLLVGGATFLAGMAGVAVWAETRRAGDGTTSSTTGPSTTGPAAAVTTAPPTTTPAATTPDTTLLDTTTSAPATSIVASSTSLAVVGPATYVNHGPSDVDNVALTFHLGGNPTLVAELLDLLKTSGVHSTLFAIGDWLTANPQLGHRAVDDGHELGNHTKSHLSMLKLSRSAVRAEIVGGGEALIPFIGSIGKWFRPSGTDVPTDLILEEAGAAGYPVSVGYDIDSTDYTEPGAAAVVARVKKQLHPGAIVSLHFGHRDTIDALPKILDLLGAAGLTPVTVTALLG
ncbi:MAG: polysaccharide deacetylase family protein [Ilumatobacteraceae bacterium]